MLSLLARAIWTQVVCAVLAAAGAWYITDLHYTAKIAEKRSAWAKDIKDNNEKAATSCAEQMKTQGVQCNDSLQKVVANGNRVNAVSDRLRQITASCGVLQANPTSASGYDSASGRFWVDAQAVADLARIAGASANNYDAANTLDQEWPKQ